jgi:hypothetical protein
MSLPHPFSPIETAELFARQHTTPDAPFDFSPASLAAALALVLRLVDDDAARDDADDLVQASCYIGEVVRRTLGGEWAGAGGGADMLRGVAGRAGEVGTVIPLSDLMLVLAGPAPSLAAWYENVVSGAQSSG